MIWNPKLDPYAYEAPVDEAVYDDPAAGADAGSAAAPEGPAV
jgi:hypothetical protein